MAATYAPSSSGTRVTLRVGNLPPYLTHEDFQRLWQSSDGWLGGRVLGSGHGVAEFSSLIAAQRAKSTYEGWTGFGAPLSLNVDAAPAAPQPSENFAYDPEMFGKLAQTRPGAASAQAPVHQYGQSRASTQPQHSQAQGVYQCFFFNAIYSDRYKKRHFRGLRALWIGPLADCAIAHRVIKSELCTAAAARLRAAIWISAAVPMAEGRARAALVPASDFQQHVDSAKQELAATADAVVRDLHSRFLPPEHAKGLAIVYAHYWDKQPSDEDFLERLAIVKARYCMDATLANGQLAPALLDQQKLSAQQSAFVEVMRCQAEHRVELSSAAANPAKETTKLWRYLAGQPITKADILEYIKLAELDLVMTPGSLSHGLPQR